MSLKNVILLLLFFGVSASYAQTSASVQVRVLQLEAPQLDTLRTVRIYLPKSYENSQESYPVVYMHDAQNLFDSTTSLWREWLVDEFLDFQRGADVIVVGIDHGEDRRIAELTPFPNKKYGGGEGASYVDFIVRTLKPYIDCNFRTLQGSKNTAIMGSSLGGLISFYAALKHPDIFGKAGVFSPSFWFSERIFDFTRASEISKDSHFYFLGGTAESETMVSHLEQMKKLLLKQGLPKENIRLKIVPGGEHNEEFWSREFPEAFQWLFYNRKL